MAALFVVQFHWVAGFIAQSGGGGCATGTGCRRQGRRGGGALGTEHFQFTEPAAHADGLFGKFWPKLAPEAKLGSAHLLCQRRTNILES